MTHDEFVDLWRHDLQGKGYFLVDAGVLGNSTETMMGLRERMRELAEQLNGFSEFRQTVMQRFDQQEVTRFHQDGGPEHCILMLGYEPSKVKSRIFLADHVAAANDLGESPSDLIQEALRGKEEKLEHYTTELPPFEENHAYILLINNSKDLGVLHKAVPEKNEAEHRFINSVMLYPPDETVFHSYGAVYDAPEEA